MITLPVDQAELRSTCVGASILAGEAGAGAVGAGAAEVAAAWGVAFQGR